MSDGERIGEMEGPPTDAGAAAGALRGGVVPWLLSGRSRDALRAQAERLRVHVAEDPALDVVDVGLSLTGRPLLEDRAVVLGHGREELQSGVGMLARGESAENVIEGALAVEVGGLAFLFTGQGAQRVGMGRELYERFPVFRAAFDEACVHLDEHLGCSLREVVFGGALLDETRFTQAGLFAFEVALFRLVQSLGVQPEFVVGHSVGELVAAHVAGVFSLEDACRLVAARGRLMGELPAGGAMVSVRASEEEALASLEGFEGRVELAAVNGPLAVVLSGDEDAVLELASMWEARGRKTKRLRVSHAFHSPRMDAMLEEFARVAEGLSFSEPQFYVVSDVTGEVASAEQLCDPAYWVRHVREPVRFAACVQTLREREVTSFLEVGPDGVLSAMVRDCLAEEGDPRRASAVGVVPALRAGRGEERTLLAGLAALWARGVEVAWGELFVGSGAERVELPTYAFQRERYWLGPAVGTGSHELRPLAADDLPEAHERYHQSLFRLGWVETQVGSGVAPERLALLGAGAMGIGEALERVGIAVDRYEDLQSLRDAVAAGRPGPETVIVDGAGEVGEDGLCAAAHLCVKRMLGALQEWLADDLLVDSRLVVVTAGAVAARGEEDVHDLAGAPVWGLVRTAQSEYPGRLSLLDLDGHDASWSALPAALATGDRPEIGEQLAIREGQVLAPHLVWAAPGEPRETPAFDEHSRVLITGGVSGLGAVIARHLVVSHGVRDLLLVSRRGLEAQGARELVDEFAQLGAQATVVACDVSDRAQLERMLSAAPNPITAVVHAAGVLRDGVIQSLSPAQLDEVLTPKLDAALHLHELTAELDLSAFVLFSSAAATFGSAGQGNYAAANAFLDGLAAHRRAQGLPAVSIAWGLWEQATGMTGGLGQADVARIERHGMLALSSEEGLEIFDIAARADEPALLAVPLRMATLRDRASAGALPAILRGLVRASAGVAPDSATADGADRSLGVLLRGVPEWEREELAIEFVRAETAGVLGHSSPQAIAPERAFKELGLDSLAALELHNRLQAATGLRLPSTLVFDHPSPAVLGRHLLAEALDARAEVGIEAVVVGRADEPIAIVGMSCRFPGGVGSPRELWELLAESGDAIGAFPADRGWDLEGLYDPDPERHGHSYAREGGFVYDAGEFDAAFFGISPREALAMDPQQRLLLESCWEAVEHASIDLASLRGSQTGVFVGSAPSGYGGPQASRSEPSIEGYLMMGSAGSVTSGRVAYTLGLEGPAVTVDTACSSSLVALHLACGALRGGECRLALAGGVTVLATPDVFVEFSRQRGLAPDGRCKPFADAADGTGWSEGVGVLLLERLSDARRNGHEVLAVVRGSAVNQDGASNGLSAPNGPSQQRVILQALANAGLRPADVDAVEAHGTGTTLGDPIEAQALIATYGQDRARPLWLGSVKSNIGHTQTAAGVAGVIKIVMALRHGALPRTLHVDEPSARVDWSAGSVSLLTEEVPWERGERPRRAGVSAFGISGTNAHAIIEEAPPADLVSPSLASPDCGALPWVLSGTDAQGLRRQAGRLRALVDGDPDLGAADVGRSLAARTELEHRAVVVGADREELLAGVGALVHGETPGSAIGGQVAAEGRRVAFMFTGQGAQRVGMGRELYEAFPVFRAAFEEVCAHIDPELGCSLREVVFGEGEGAEERLDGTAYAQPALFALEVALHRLIEAWGVRADFLVGHSIGELVAAHVAGVFSLEDACRLVAARGRLMGALPEGGAMLALEASEQEALESAATLPDWEQRVALAAVNAPEAVVLSGDEDALLELAEVWQQRGRNTKRLSVSHAFHSPRMDAMLEEFERVAEGISYAAPQIPLVSNLSGALAAGEDLRSPAYWVRHVRHTVRFADGVAWLREQGVGCFLELGPAGVLSALVEECIDHESLTPAEPGDGESQEAASVDDKQGVVVAPIMRLGWGEAQTLLTAVGEAWVRGVEVEWARAFDGLDARRVELPSYAFQRERYWLSGRAADAGGDSWRYRVRWKPVGEHGVGVLAGVWPVVVAAGRGDDQWVAGVVDALGARGAKPIVVEVEATADRDELAARLSEPAGGVLSLLALDEGFPGVAATLALIQALGDADTDAPLWCVTRGAVSVGAGDPLHSPTQAQVWGLGRVAGLEEPDRWGGLIDLPAQPDRHELERLGAVLAREEGEREHEVAVRGGGLFASRLAHAPAVTNAAAPAYVPRGTVLVTGGTGALGAHVARWLARGGAERIVLSSRRGPQAPGAAELAAELRELGASVSVAACDVADRPSLERLLADEVPAEHPLDAVFHIAGVLDDGLLDGLTAKRLHGVLRAKVDAAWHLHELTQETELSAFVLFSSIAGTLGSGGQGAYAAGNAYLDALAEHRRGHGLPASSIAWGPWVGEGMAAAAAERLRRGGVRELPVGVALAGLQQTLERGESAVVADLDWERLLADLGPTGPGRMRTLLGDLPEFERLTRGPDTDGGAGGWTRGSLAARLAALPAAEREPTLLELVRAQASALLGHDSPDAVAPDRAFRDLGFDSLAGVQLRNRLAAESGLRLPATLVFDYPTAAELAAHLLALVQGTPSAASAVAVVGPVEEPVAIVGIGCRYPGGVGSAAQLWELLERGEEAIGPFPADRGWDLEGLYDPDPERSGTCYVREGGFLYDAGEFDAAFFGVGPREALAMDPQQRLLLEVCWEAFEDGGLDPLALKGTPTGVFAGINIRDYATGPLDAEAREVEGYLGTGSAGSVVSGRVAYTFGLEGPAVTVDTACSSSLVALHLACQSLRGGECELALAGGVTVMSTPGVFVDFARQRGLAADGRCKPFADAADGTGWGEGVGVLLLQRLSVAQRAGRRVLGVVRGSAVNQDGASNGLTAPNGPSQQRVIMRALAAAGLVPAEVDAVEAHGTGTTLGDPIEAQALLATYGQARPADAPLWLGSIKSNIGHTQAAAGVAGVIKMAMALRHERLPRTLHVDRPSGEVDWSAGAVELLTEERPWRANGRPRRAGISSFGISGTNAHVILEEAPPLPDPAPADTPVLELAPAAGASASASALLANGGLPVAGIVPWVLSARGVEGLRAQAARLRDFLADAELDAADVGLSLTARATLEDRAVLLGESRDQLLEGLTALASGQSTESVLGIVDGPLADLAETWVRGEHVDWSSLFAGVGAKRVPLPSYAFQRERFWLGGDQAVERWRYRVRWKLLDERPVERLSGIWMVVVPAELDRDELRVGVVGALEAQGAGVAVLQLDEKHGDRDALAERLRELLGRERLGAGGRLAEAEGDGRDAVGGVLLLAAARNGEGASAAGATATLVVTQALEDAGVQAPLWCVTSGAVSVGEEDPLSSPAQALVWGLGRVVGLEQPGRWGGLIDLPADPDERACERLCGVLAGRDGEDELAVRPEGVFARRLARPKRDGGRQPAAYTPRGTVLVTGGTGALGAHVARWLAGVGAERLLLTSRRGVDAPGVAELAAELEELGASVSVAACDVADRRQIRELLESVPHEHPLSAVFHAAGVMDDDAIGELSVAQLEGALAGKAGGAWHLHELTRELELDAFVLFSSIAAIFGGGGQGAYAAGNAFLDALAEHRRGQGLPATSVAWGAWAGEGMALGAGERLERHGIRELPVRAALGALRDALEADVGCLVVADLEWERYALTYSSARARPLIGELPDAQRALREAAGEVTGVGVGAAGAAGAGASSEWALCLVGMREHERERVALELVREHAAGVLGHASPEAVPAGRTFRELGFDSLAGVQLVRALRAATGLRLAPTAVFDHPTPAALAAHLRREAAGERAAVRVAAPAARDLEQPVAIVGIGCRYPGASGTVRSAAELWELLARGEDGIGPFPADRGWDLEGLYDPDPDRAGTSYAREGGFLRDAAEFDAAFFGIGPREALAMDPQQRLLLEVCWEALEDAGIDPLSLRESQTGVFAGVGSSGYMAGADAAAGLEGYRLTGTLTSVVSGRVSYALGLEGPAVSVDTACSSSLVALHWAAQSLRAGECTLALAGGVAVMARPDAFVEFSRQRGLAPDGRCKSFADAADGTGWSEGAGIVLLEGLADAQRNGHQVLGVLRGSAINQDGASNGLTAPSGPSQQRVIMQALANAGLSPAEVDAVEAHGTGTTLGDPIEAQALLATYGQERAQDAPLWVGSVKSNIGHAAAAAGVAGVIKMVMALAHERLPRTLHVDTPSTRVDWSTGGWSCSPRSGRGGRTAGRAARASPRSG